MLIPRPYQQRVIDAICEALAQGCMSPCASVATGGGKSVIVSELARRFTSKGKRCLAASHVKELINQLHQTAEQHGMTDIGIHAASLKRRDLSHAYVIAQVQSIYKRMCEVGRIDALIIDEVHLLGDTENGMYRTLIKTARVVNPDMRIIGLSATPWRAKSGLIYGGNRFFEKCVAHIGMKELIEDGYLTPLVGKSGDRDPHLEGVKIRGGDYVPGELEKVMADEKRVKAAIGEIIRHCTERQRILIFSAGLKHNEMIVTALHNAGWSADSVNGQMVDGERDERIKAFRAGDTRCLVNCSILTTGYDDPDIDAIILLRPTRSAGLLLQMCGRGLRKSPNKQDCLILDFGGALEFFGPLDEIENRIKKKNDAKAGGQAPQKTCPECHLVVPAGLLTCSCGYVWPKAIATHETKASDASPLSSTAPIPMKVDHVIYAVHAAKDPTKPATLRVTYRCSINSISEFISIDSKSHPYARAKALSWLRETPTMPGPDGRILVTHPRPQGTWKDGPVDITTAQSLCAFSACLQKPVSIEARRNGEYWNVMKRTFVQAGVA